MAKVKLDIQLFNSSEDEWFNEEQQRALIEGVRKGLQGIVQGVERVGARLDQLTGQWHSQDAEKYGNPTADDFNTFSPKAIEYVNSVGNWMASHGAHVNVMQGNEVHYSNLDGSVNSKVGNFSDDSSRRGLENADTAENTANVLRDGVEIISNGFKDVLNAVRQNPDAMPKGVVPNSLEPVVSQENAKITEEFASFRDSISEFLKALHEAIVSSSAQAARDANGG